MKKEATVVSDEFDDLVTANTGKSLAAWLGNSPELISKKAKASKKTGSDNLVQSKLNFKKVSGRHQFNCTDKHGNFRLNGDNW